MAHATGLASVPPAMKTTTLPVDVTNIGTVQALSLPDDLLGELHFNLDLQSPDAQNIREAAEKLRASDIPVAFPTETVYGLGADATRSAAVRGIYQAKQRPSDNPLIVHFSSLRQLRSLLRGYVTPQVNGGVPPHGSTEDPIPAIYRPLISRFWPGPLTIILPNPTNSPLAPEVTAGLQTFGARVPRHVLALALISLANIPIAAPSANASTKPSPTAAEHVAYDLDGRIETIIDGGPCDVGVESTVVDGLSSPPLILRPGGISLEQIRMCPGWEGVQIGYKNISEKGTQPRAPGMKYRHYSPKATVILFEVGTSTPTSADLQQHLGPFARLGIIRTRSWEVAEAAASSFPIIHESLSQGGQKIEASCSNGRGFAGMAASLHAGSWTKPDITKHELEVNSRSLQLLDIDLGSHTADIARGIFSALRDLDRHNVDAIFVEGIDDTEGDNIAGAVMNRLRKAAEIRVT